MEFSVLTPNINDAYDFANKMRELNIRWCSGKPFTENTTNWDVYKTETYYDVSVIGIRYCGIHECNTSYSVIPLALILSCNSLEELSLVAEQFIKNKSRRYGR